MDPAPKVADIAQNDNDVLEVARAELMYRREKQWHIFAWTTTLLVAVIGGAITLTGKVCAPPAKSEVFYSALQYLVMGGAVIVLALYARVWINENMRLENLARKKVVELLKVHRISVVLPDPKKLPIGYVQVVVLVTAGALLALAAPFFPRACVSLVNLLAD
ncbi:MAG: hypothetical protein K2X57_16235 [Xanthobacteraceae bacterium]|nr:hypothetical protein [Xanthobacteraceae bacterium]